MFNVRVQQEIKWMNQTLVLSIPITLSVNGIPDKMFQGLISIGFGEAE